MTDTVADMIIQIKNAYLAHKEEVRLPCSQLREDIGHLLVEEGYLSEVSREPQTPQDVWVTAALCRRAAFFNSSETDFQAWPAHLRQSQ